MNSFPTVDLRTEDEKRTHEARERTQRAVATLAKVDQLLRAELYDILWEQRRNANPWRPSMRPADLQEPFA